MAGLIPPLRVALAQINCRVGDLEGNATKITEQIGAARDAGAEIVVFPELALTGYPPEDLLLKEHFLQAAAEALADLAGEAEGIVVLVGYPERADDVHNALAVLADGRLHAVYRKSVLPNYGVFDEKRYFQVGDGGAVLELGNARLGLTICEDMWTPGPPFSDEAAAGASLIINASASPYHAGKGIDRERMLIQRARDNLCAVAFCNLVGGQDELVFDGHSLLLDHEGKVLARGPQFAESLVIGTVDLQDALTARLRDTRLREPVSRALPEVRRLDPLPRREATSEDPAGGFVTPVLEPEAEVYAALVLGTRDYVEKNGFEHVVIGLSGGIDSTLTALIAVDALGADRVTCVTMPSRYSSAGTRGDAKVLAENLGVELHEIAIGKAMEVYDELLGDLFEGREPDITEENLQARIRGNILMALSNKFGWLVLTTGNKSENSVGYSTLYGDSAGGFAVIKDVPKTLVYRLTDYRNARDEDHPVPRSIIDRPPSAELRDDQRDADSLGDYDTLDAILEAYVEEDHGPEQLERAGLPHEAVEKAISLVDRAEYKRRQAPPGIKITPRAFGRDRRMPITNAYRPGEEEAARPLANRDGHADEGAEAALVVGDVDLPDPGRAAAVAAAGDGVDRAFDDRAQEARLVREALGGLALAVHLHPRRHRRHRLGDRREDAPVDEAGGLAQLVAHLDLRADLLVAVAEQLESVEAVEADGKTFERGGHEAGHTTLSTGMTPLDTLAPDQRAVLELVLRQGRSYGELSELLAIPERDVRARADAGLRALTGEPAAGVDSGRIADWLLGQQPEAESARTRAAVARNPLARDWAAAAAERLSEVGGEVPEVPAGDEPVAARHEAASPARDDAPPAPRPREVRDGTAGLPRPERTEAAPRSSRLGGAIVIGVAALLVAGTLAYLFILRDDEEPAAGSGTQAEATATPAATPAAEANDIVLEAADGSQAAGLMRLIKRDNGTVQFALAAQNVPPNQGQEVYAIWFTREGSTPRRLGFAQAQVGEEGILTTGGPQKRDEKNFPRWFATYETVLVTRETDAKAKEPGPVVLEGTLPAGAG